MSKLTRGSRFRFECALVGVVSVLWTGLIYTGYGGPAVSQAVSNVGLAAVALAAAAACAASALRRHGRDRLVWSLLAGSALSWGLGQLIWTWYETVLREEPFPSLADVGYLGAVPLATAALLAMPTAAQTVAGRVRAVLDGLMIASALFLTSWVLVLGPLVHAGGEGLLSQSISLAYPVGDVVLVTIVVHVILQARQSRGVRVRLPLGLVGAGLAAIAVADSGFLYLQITESYASGNPIDAGWFVGYGLILLAARRPSNSDASEIDADETRPLGLLLPYAAVAIALTASSAELLRTGSVEQVVSWTRTVIIVLMVARQILTLLENSSLTRHLEARVAERTAELRASERRFEALVQHSSEAVTVVDLDATVTYQSESVERVFGRDTQELLGTPLTTIFDATSARRLSDGLQQAAREPYGIRVLELTFVKSSQEPTQVEMTITNLLENPSVRGLVLNTRDVTERRRLEGQLVHEAFHDSLTGLANRALFKDRVEHALTGRRGADRTVTVLFLDLDGFKEVNDSLGHAAGDILLTRVAERLRSSVRANDTVARLGGDEFAVLIEDGLDDLRATDGAQRITAGLEVPFFVTGQEIHVRASVGIATAGPEDDADQVLRNADLAMYRAKAAGEGGYTRYDPRMHAELVERLELEADLRHALDHDEFILHYQPTISLSTGEIVGVEALIRWNHPTRGLLLPGTFIAAAENMGLIPAVGRWVLREACHQAAAWPQAGMDGRPFTTSVNISVCQLQHGDLVQDVADALAAQALRPEQLVLEMTESVLLDHTEDNLALLRHIRSMGVRLAIDDFGTGYSSLSYLQRFPFDILKIDRSFIDRLMGTSQEVELVRTIIGLGQSLRMTTVAEGIEDHNQFLALRRIGCELGQGYHFHRPVSAATVTALLGDNALDTGQLAA